MLVLHLLVALRLVTNKIKKVGMNHLQLITCPSNEPMGLQILGSRKATEGHEKVLLFIVK